MDNILQNGHMDMHFFMCFGMKNLVGGREFVQDENENLNFL
jgi:hypothetical protein